MQRSFHCAWAAKRAASATATGPRSTRSKPRAIHVQERDHTRDVYADRRPSASYPYLLIEVRSAMDVAARITSKGQVTIPKPVREALNLGEGDQVLFRVIEGGRAILARTPDLLDLAGSVPVPADVRGLSWEEIRRRAWAGQLRG
jgi:AbrB family looped-hinge helix DNA binding protein